MREHARSSRRAILLAGGLAVLGLLLSACGALTGSSDDRLPDEIDSEASEEIAAVLTLWIAALNRDEIGVSSFYTLTPGELGVSPEAGRVAYQRLAIEVAAYTRERLAYEFRGLRTATIEDDRAIVEFETNFGPRVVEMVVRGGQWKIFRLPRMLVPTEEGPVQIGTRVVREVERSPLERAWLVEFTNESDVPAMLLSAWAFTFDEQGYDEAIGSFTASASRFLRPGEATLARIDGRLRRADGTSTEIVGVFRRASESDQRSRVDVRAMEVALTREGPAERLTVTGRVTNPALELIAIRVIAALYDPAGELVALAPWRESGAQLIPGESVDISIPVSFNLHADDASRVDLLVFASTLPPQ